MIFQVQGFFFKHCFISLLGFLAPDKIDSKFFDPKHAFKEVEVQAKTVRELIPVKKPKVCMLQLVFRSMQRSCSVETKTTFCDVSHKINICSVAAPVFQAEGYTDGDLTLFHSFPITAFLKAENPVDFLAKASEVRSLGYGTAPVAKSDKYPDLISVFSYSDHL